jgi:predicted HNH restriction endonuclease
MNAFEYRKELTPLQSKAFYKLLEKKLEDSGYYPKNREFNDKINQLHREAVSQRAEEFGDLRYAYQTKKDELEQQIKQLQAERDELWETYSKEKDALSEKAYLSVEDKVKEIREARGNSSLEREIIENLAIAEFQRKLEKKEKQTA